MASTIEGAAGILEGDGQKVDSHRKEETHANGQENDLQLRVSQNRKEVTTPDEGQGEEEQIA
jgi:hypothetical protein